MTDVTFDTPERWRVDCYGVSETELGCALRAFIVRSTRKPRLGASCEGKGETFIAMLTFSGAMDEGGRRGG